MTVRVNIIKEKGQLLLFVPDVSKEEKISSFMRLKMVFWDDISRITEIADWNIGDVRL